MSFFTSFCFHFLFVFLNVKTSFNAHENKNELVLNEKKKIMNVKLRTKSTMNIMKTKLINCPTTTLHKMN